MQKLGPDRLGFRRADLHAQNLVPAVGVDGGRDDRRYRDDPAATTNLEVGGVNPQIRPLALDRSIKEGFTLVVDLFAQPADLALGDAAHAHGLDQVVDRAGRDILDIGLLDHRGQRLFGQPPRLEEAGEVAALPELGNAQLDGAGPRLPVPLAVAVALRKALRALLAIGGSRSLGSLGA